MTDFIKEVKAAAAQTKIRERVNITPNSPPFVGPILRAKLVVFERHGVLRFSDARQPFVAVIADQVHIQDGNSNCQIIVPQLNGLNGADGRDGSHGVPGKKDGSDAEDGLQGKDGSTPPQFVFWVDDLTYGIEPNSNTSPLTIESLGGNGGNGGSGGDGGNGLNGGRSWPGLGGKWGSRPP